MERYFGSERQRLCAQRLSRHPTEPKRSVFSRANIRAMKEWNREIGYGIEWKAYKREAVGLERPITDEEFRAILNARRKADPSYMPPPAY